MTGCPSDAAPGSLPSVSSDGQMSGHADGDDDEATSLPHVASDESVTETGLAAASDSPLTAARMVIRLDIHSPVPVLQSTSSHEPQRAWRGSAS